MIPSPRTTKWLYALAFAEGAAVMATEICSAKFLAPYYGSSLYVWSAVMAITLAGLAGGYFLGGFLSQQKNIQRNLSFLLIVAGLYMIALPLLGKSISILAFHTPMLVAVVLSTLLLIFPPLLLMGASSPMIIASLTQKASLSGKSSGQVYAVSTVGGILATFLCGFYLIPEYGLHTALSCFAALLVLIPLALLYRQSRQRTSLLMAILTAAVFYGVLKGNDTSNALYYSEGMMGQLEVIDGHDARYKDSTGHPALLRRLMVNNIIQTEMDLQSKRSVSEYAQLIAANTGAGKGRKALILGLGGGVIANQLEQQGFEVTGVELDPRIIWLATHYFSMSPRIHVIAEDARYFLNHCQEKFDLILFDVFKGEEQPAHVLTLESCRTVKQLLREGGSVMINWHGYSSGHKGLGTAILNNTLQAAGFETRFAASSVQEDYRNILVLASSDRRPLVTGFRPELPLSAKINTDEHPLFEKYNASANYAWRKHYLQYFAAASE